MYHITALYFAHKYTIGFILDVVIQRLATTLKRMNTRKSKRGNTFCINDPLWGESTGHWTSSLLLSWTSPDMFFLIRTVLHHICSTIVPFNHLRKVYRLKMKSGYVFWNNFRMLQPIKRLAIYISKVYEGQVGPKKLRAMKLLWTLVLWLCRHLHKLQVWDSILTPMVKWPPRSKYYSGRLTPPLW